MNEQLEVLLKEYEDRREENSIHFTRYNKQANYAYLYASVVIAISGILPSLETALAKIPTNYQQIFLVAVFGFAAMVGFYLFSSTLDSLYMMYVNGIRAGVIEKQINTILGKDILVWNLQILNQLHSPSLMRIKDWVKPSVLVVTWTMLFFVGTVFVLCFLTFIFARQYFEWYVVIISAITTFHLHQWFALNKTGVRYLWKTIQQISGASEIDNMTNREIVERSKQKKSYHKIYFHWTSITTIVVGVLPMALLSYITGSFWPSSKYEFPLLLNASVVLGDLLLLPIFNYYVFNLTKECLEMLKKHSVISVVSCATLLGMSTLCQLWIHLVWVSDQFTGFMDLKVGELSVAGWWHFGFSSFQTTLIIGFLILWFFGSQNRKQVFKLGLSGWRIFTVYLLIGLIDVIIQMQTAFKGIEWTEMIALQWSLFLRLIFTIAILFIAEKKLQID